jgi:putative phosphoesterase
MRLAIVSDIHGNLTALEAVIADLKRTSPDLVVQGGDLATSGHRPAQVIDRIRELGWPGIHGNTDEMLWAPEKPGQLAQRSPKIAGLLAALQEIGPATRERIGEERLQWLRNLPQEWRRDDVALVHARPGDLWKAPMPDCDPAELAATYAPLRAGVAVYGHIHRPYVRRLPEFTVANSGSVGMPFDDDPRASYLLIEDGKVAIRRVEYDVEAEIRDSLPSGYPRLSWLAEIRRKARYVPPF